MHQRTLSLAMIFKCLVNICKYTNNTTSFHIDMIYTFLGNKPPGQSNHAVVNLLNNIHVKSIRRFHKESD